MLFLSFIILQTPLIYLAGLENMVEMHILAQQTLDLWGRYRSTFACKNIVKKIKAVAQLVQEFGSLNTSLAFFYHNFLLCISWHTYTDTHISAMSYYGSGDFVRLLHNKQLERFSGLAMLHKANTLHINLIKLPSYSRSLKEPSKVYTRNSTTKVLTFPSKDYITISWKN